MMTQWLFIKDKKWLNYPFNWLLLVHSPWRLKYGVYRLLVYRKPQLEALLYFIRFYEMVVLDLLRLDLKSWSRTPTFLFAFQTEVFHSKASHYAETELILFSLIIPLQQSLCCLSDFLLTLNLNTRVRGRERGRCLGWCLCFTETKKSKGKYVLQQKIPS